MNDSGQSVVLVLIWAAVLLHAWLRDGPTRPPRPPLSAVAVLGATLALGAWIERQSAWRAFHAPAVSAAGMVLVWLGALLHVQARRALGGRWRPTAAPLEGDRLLRRGPYAVVRHPLYAALGLMAVGTALAHPSVAVLAGASGLAAGLAAKIRLEERALRRRFGVRWDAYARRVPALLPRRFRRGRRR